jgi:hypothetical protein
VKKGLVSCVKESDSSVKYFTASASPRMARKCFGIAFMRDNTQATTPPALRTAAASVLTVAIIRCDASSA